MFFVVCFRYRAIGASGNGDGGTFQLIDGVHSNFYQPSVDDVGARICCQLADAGLQYELQIVLYLSYFVDNISRG
jgi:hypothetical protein